MRKGTAVFLTFVICCLSTYASQQQSQGDRREIGVTRQSQTNSRLRANIQNHSGQRLPHVVNPAPVHEKPPPSTDPVIISQVRAEPIPETVCTVMRPAREERRLIVGVVLEDYHRMPEYAGYDFSEGTVLPYNDEYTDMYLDNINDELYMMVREGDTDIKDMGRANSLSEITIVPVSGWSAEHDVRLQTGHTYVGGHGMTNVSNLGYLDSHPIKLSLIESIS
jgi:hypothetical protein